MQDRLGTRPIVRPAATRAGTPLTGPSTSPDQAIGHASCDTRKEPKP